MTIISRAIQSMGYFFLTGCLGVTNAFTKSSNDPLILSFSSYLFARFDRGEVLVLLVFLAFAID
jgi:hypothetical protein